MLYKSIAEIITDISAISKKNGKKSALFVTNFLVEDDVVMMNSIKESVNFIYGYCEIGSLDIVKLLMNDASKDIDYIFLHNDLYGAIEMRPANLLVFDDKKCWFDSVISLVQILYSRAKIEKVLLAGDSWLLHKITDDLAGYSLGLDIFEPVLSGQSKELIVLKQKSDEYSNVTLVADLSASKRKYDLVISTSVKEQVFTRKYAASLGYKVTAIDAGIGGFSEEIILHLCKNGSDVYRVDIRSALSALMLSSVENIDLIENVKGQFNYKGIRVVGGGEMGYYGDVIVDNISSPGCVIGIADGSGKTLYPPYEKVMQDKIDTIEGLINS